MFFLKYLILESSGLNHGNFPHLNHSNRLFNELNIFKTKFISFFTEEI